MTVTRPDIVEYGPRRRRWVGIVVVAGLLAIPLFGILDGRGDPAPPPPAAAATPSRTAGTPPATVNAVFPRERGDGDTRTIAVTFPDGTRATVTYPAEMRLAEFGVRPHIGATLAVPGESARFRLLTAPYRGEADVARSGPMIRHLTDDVTLWPGPPGAPTAGEVLLFAFGRWRLALQDEHNGLNFDQRRTWARSLRGRVTRDGFLVLSARSPLRLARPGDVYNGVVAGPQLWLGGVSGPLIVLTPTPDCARRAVMPLAVQNRPGVSDGACQGDVHVAVSGEPEFVRQVLEQVRVRTRT
jgi:hypothetical protein